MHAQLYSSMARDSWSIVLAFCLLIRGEVLQLLLWKKNLVAGMRFPATNNLPRLLGAISGRVELLEERTGAEITVKIRYRERSALETFSSRPDIDDSGTFRGFQQNSISVSRLLNDACSGMKTPLRDSCLTRLRTSFVTRISRDFSSLPADGRKIFYFRDFI